MPSLNAFHDVLARVIVEKRSCTLIQKITRTLPNKIPVVLLFMTALRFIHVKCSHKDFFSIDNPPGAMQMQCVLANFRQFSPTICFFSAFAKVKHSHITRTTAQPKWLANQDNGRRLNLISHENDSAILLPLLLLPSQLQIRPNQLVQVAVQHAIDVSDLYSGSQVFYHAIGLQYIRANL